MPIGTGPNAHHRRNFLILTDRDFHPQVLGVIHRRQFINHLKSWIIAEMVDARNIKQKVIPKVAMASAQKYRDRIQRHCHAVLAAKFVHSENFFREPAAQTIDILYC